MKLSAWKTGVEGHIPALEAFMKNVLLRKCKVKVNDAATGSDKDAAGMLGEYSIIMRAVEENFETEVLFGFSESWISTLAREILGVEDTQNNEITRDLFSEFVSHLIELIRASFNEIGIELKITEVESIKSGQLGRSLNLQKYSTAVLEVEPRFEIEERSSEPLLFAVALAHPNKDKAELLEVSFTENNPFENGDYSEASLRHAGFVNLKRVEEDAEASAGGSGINVKGKEVEFQNFDRSTVVENSREVRNIDILKNVKMNLSVELGRREMQLGKILQLVKGSVIELEKLAGEPVEILVNGHKIAQGDVVVIDEHFGVRISHLLATQEHIKGLS